MCTPTAAGTMIPYGLKIPSPYFSFGPSNGGGGGGGVTQGQLAALDFQRSQLHDYNVRVQLGLRNYQNSLGLSPFHAYITDPYAHAYFYKHDPRARFVQEEPKPSHSYIGLIGMAILQSKDKKLVLSDIYQWILDNYPYFRTRGPGWRNSIRHNLSLNDCFIKSGRSANGKGHYWAVHPANVEDFERGDFRRRRAQRKVRRHMGLAVPDDDDSPSPSPTQPWMHHHDILGSGSADKASSPTGKDHGDLVDVGSIRDVSGHNQEAMRLLLPQHHPHHPTPAFGLAGLRVKKPSRKRLFDMASLLAPDEDDVDESSPEKIRSLSSPQTTSSASGMSYSNIINTRISEGCEDDEREHYCQNKVQTNTRDGGNGNRGHIVYDDDDTFCDDDDDEDNCEEIHVTSDDESGDRVNPDSKCLSDMDSDLSGQNSSTKTLEENSNLIKTRVAEEVETGNKFEHENEHHRGPQHSANQIDNRHSTSFSESNNVHFSEHQTSTRLLNNTALLKQSQSIVHNATTMKAIYELMSDKLRDQDNNVFHSSERQAANIHSTHAQTSLSKKDDTGSVICVTDEHFKSPRNSLHHESNASKDDKLGNSHNSDHPIPRQSLEHHPSSSLPESLSNSVRNEHQHRSLQSNIGKDFPGENNFSAFEALGIRPNPSIFTSSHIHPGMLRAMTPFSGPTSLLSQGPVARPGIPTSCLQMLQASTAVPAPSLPALSSHTVTSAAMGKR